MVRTNAQVGLLDVREVQLTDRILGQRSSCTAGDQGDLRRPVPVTNLDLDERRGLLFLVARLERLDVEALLPERPLLIRGQNNAERPVRVAELVRGPREVPEQKA